MIVEHVPKAGKPECLVVISPMREQRTEISTASSMVGVLYDVNPISMNHSWTLSIMLVGMVMIWLVFLLKK